MADPKCNKINENFQHQHVLVLAAMKNAAKCGKSKISHMTDENDGLIWPRENELLRVG